MVVVLLVVGAVTGLLAKHSSDQTAAKHKKQAAAASAPAAAARRSASAASASASAVADAKQAQDAVDRSDRKELISSLHASVNKDAKKDVDDGVLDGPIKHTECTPTNGASDLLLASNTSRASRDVWVCRDGPTSSLDMTHAMPADEVCRPAEESGAREAGIRFDSSVSRPDAQRGRRACTLR